MGCNTYGEYCDDNPIFVSKPVTQDYYQTAAVIERVPNGTVMEAACFGTGPITYNYAAQTSPPDPGPNPYQSDVYYRVRAPSGSWGWVSDAFFARSGSAHLQLQPC